MADYYGAPEDQSTSKTLGERLRDKYEPEDFVEVMNIDTQPLKYQFTSPSDLETFSDYPGHKDTIQKHPPQVVVLQPGERKLVPAYEADRMLTVLIKQIAVRNTANQIGSGSVVRWQTTNWNDPKLQEEILRQALLGKEDVLGMYNRPNRQADITKDLGLDDEPPASARRGRPPKAQESA